MINSFQANITTPFVRLVLLGYLLLLVLISIGNLHLFKPNWPFELFVSYSLQVMLLAPLTILLAWFFWRKSLLALTILFAFAFTPFLFFTKYEQPSNRNCEKNECLHIVSTNLRGRHDAFNRLTTMASQYDFDVIGISELPESISLSELKNAFPKYSDYFFVSHDRMGNPLGSRLAIITRKQMLSKTYFATKVSSDYFLGRATIMAALELKGGEKVNIFLIHPRLPLSRASMHTRDTSFQELATKIGASQNFIILGDFNLTPWTPIFKNLPGKRAGDPRFTYTWDAKRPWLGIPIDHILVDNKFEVFEASTYPSIGSDHLPIMAVIGMK